VRRYTPRKGPGPFTNKAGKQEERFSTTPRRRESEMTSRRKEGNEEFVGGEEK